MTSGYCLAGDYFNCEYVLGSFFCSCCTAWFDYTDCMDLAECMDFLDGNDNEENENHRYVQGKTESGEVLGHGAEIPSDSEGEAPAHGQGRTPATVLYNVV